MKSIVKYSELLNTQNRKLLKSWVIQGKASLLFDENCKGYILDLNVSSILLPKHSKDSLKIIRPYLLFQIFIYPGKAITLEIITSDSEGITRRLIITQAKNVMKNMMHARLPCKYIERNTWLHLYINIFSLFSMCYPVKTFRSIDGIFFSGTCKLRRIYSVSELDIDHLLPTGFSLPKNIPHKVQCLSSETYEFDLVSSQDFKTLKKTNISISLPKLGNKEKKVFLSQNNTHKNNIYRMKNNIEEIKKEYAGSIWVKPIKGFGIEKNEFRAVLRNKLKKITHNHDFLTNEEDFIEEDIETEAQNPEVSFIESLKLVTSKNHEKFKTPDYFDSFLRKSLNLRHETPPFVNIKGNLHYNSVEKFYELSN